MNVRRLALDLLCRHEAGEEYINLTIGRSCEALDDRDRRYLTALLYGTVERSITLDYYIGVLAKRNNLDPMTKRILRLGLYELLYMHTPAHSCVNETVNLARNSGEAGFINGILRSALRSPDLLVPPPQEKNLSRHLSVKHSIPLSTVRLLQRELKDQTDAFLSAVNAPHGMTLHINTTRISRLAYLDVLADTGIEATPTLNAPHGVLLTHSYPPKQLPGFNEGLFFVQDEASQIAIAALAPKQGARVVDLCACPGGKSFACAVTMDDTGDIRAFDLHQSKLSLITSGAIRLGLTSVHAAVQDSSCLTEELRGAGDYVLCDVPCSGLGVMGKKADLRYKDFSDIATLPTLQLSLLEAGALCLAPHGTLLYSTCTINSAENTGVTDSFLSTHPEFTYTPFTVGSISAPDGRLTLYPHIHHTDGFYIALLKRRNA